MSPWCMLRVELSGGDHATPSVAPEPSRSVLDEPYAPWTHTSATASAASATQSKAYLRRGRTRTFTDATRHDTTTRTFVDVRAGRVPCRSRATPSDVAVRRVCTTRDDGTNTTPNFSVRTLVKVLSFRYWAL